MAPLDIDTAKPPAILNVEPAVKLKVPEAAPVVRFFKVKVFALVIVISYLSLEIVDGFPFVAVNVAVPVLFVLISVVTEGDSKKLLPVVPSKPKPFW